ncbi:hypothetical protein F4677DRAFT_442340 [Hypoxylon crocopeplum]|nr:hypothetical protein F4677DRAFT_442340 [Hypoxylon crocopeplum]
MAATASYSSPARSKIDGLEVIIEIEILLQRLDQIISLQKLSDGQSHFHPRYVFPRVGSGALDECEQTFEVALKSLGRGKGDPLAPSIAIGHHAHPGTSDHLEELAALQKLADLLLEKYAELKKIGVHLDEMKGQAAKHHTESRREHSALGESLNKAAKEIDSIVSRYSVDAPEIALLLNEHGQGICLAVTSGVERLPTEGSSTVDFGSKSRGSHTSSRVTGLGVKATNGFTTLEYDLDAMLRLTTVR